jgi:hypothetical protein
MLFHTPANLGYAHLRYRMLQLIIQMQQLDILALVLGMFMFLKEMMVQV